jgi:hypothetical protein
MIELEAALEEQAQFSAKFRRTAGAMVQRIWKKD